MCLVPLAAASPSANVRNVHDLNSCVQRVTLTEQNVNSGLETKTGQ
jgi:hypothetical protein